MKRILIIKGKSTYDVLRQAADLIVDRFREREHEVLVYDLAVLDYLTPQETIAYMQKLCDEIRSEENLFIYAMNAVGFNMEDAQGGTIVDRAVCPVVGQLVDIPLLHRSRLIRHTSDQVYIGCVDKQHVDMLREYFTDIANPYFMPHRGFSCPVQRAWEDREIEVFFSGSYHDYAVEVEKIQRLEEPYRSMGLALLQNMLDDKNLFYGDGVCRVIGQFGFTADAANRLELMDKLYPVYRAIHEFYREMAISELLAADIRVTVCGTGWHNFQTDHAKNLTVLDETGKNIEEVAALMGNAKIVLNICPVFRAGAHERIFTAMLAGAVCVTDENPYLKEILPDEVVYYQVDQMERLPDIVKQVLSNPEESLQRTEKAYRLADEKYRWENEADEVLEMLGLE